MPFRRNVGFLGRDEDLAEIHALLQGDEAVGALPVAASGMGGIGKTQLAVEYAYRYAGEYPGGVYWVNAAGDWVAELASLAEQVGLREDDAPESLRPQRLARAFAAYLGADESPRAAVAPAGPRVAPLARRALRRSHPRQEPSAVVPLAGICAGAART